MVPSTIPIPIRCAAPDLAARLRAILWGLARAVGTALLQANLTDVAGPITQFLTTTIRRFFALAAHVNDGKLPRNHTRKPTGQRTGRAPKPRPTKFGWLLDKTGPGRHHVNYWRKQLEALINEPMFGHFLAPAPTAGRLLRPVCHLLALKPPILYPPKPKPEPKPAARKPDPPPPPPDPPRARPAAPSSWAAEPFRPMIPCQHMIGRWPWAPPGSQKRP